MALNAISVLMYPFSTQQLNSYYLQEDSVDCYLTEELKMFFFFLLFIFHMAFSLFLFVHSALLSLICTYIPGFCNFLRLVLLTVRFVVINFFIFLAFSLVCKCVICSSRKKKRLPIAFVELSRGNTS